MLLLTIAGMLWLTVQAAIAAGSPGDKPSDAGVVKTQDGSSDASASASRIQSLIRELGDTRYAVRQGAAEELSKIGYPAVAALEAAAGSDDPEVAATARSILKDARLGVSSTWPKDLVQKIRKYAELDAVGRDSLICRVISEMREDAVPFLVARLGSGDKKEGQSICNALKQEADAGIAGRLLSLLKDPKNEWQARAVAWAHVCRKQPQEALRVLVACRVEGEPRQSVIEQAVGDLCSKIRNKEYDEAGKVAGSFVQAAPTEARFLYLRATALRQLDEEKEARELESRALKLNPDKESPHYVAGDMLMDLGLDDLSKLEWEAILKIDPADDVYDINAWMRLGQLGERGRRNIEAAKCYETGLNLYRKKKAEGHGGYGMTISEDVLKALIGKLRRAGEAGDGVAVGRQGKQLKLDIKSIVKDGKQKELLKALRSCKVSTVVKTEPLGIRVLDLKECRLAYDGQTEEISILFNGSAACKPQRCVLGGKKAEVAVVELDCVHMFEVDPESAEVKRLDRFEKDYVIRIVPDANLRGYKGFDVKIGEKVYPWKDLLGGTTVDYLPPVLELKMEGTGEDGLPDSLQFRIPIDEKDFEAVEDSEEENRSGGTNIVIKMKGWLR